MSETRTRLDSPSGEELKATTQANAADPLQESLDELARMAESLVDDLAIEPEEPPQPVEPDEATKQSRRAALKETLDALNEMVDDTQPPLTSVEVQVEGDRGEDIAACLDRVMTADDETSEAEPEIIEPARKEAPPVAPPDPAEETGVESAVAAGVEPEIETAPSLMVEPSRHDAGTWWMVLIAIVVIIAAVAGTFWVLDTRSASSSTSSATEVPLPESPVVYTKKPAPTAETESAAVAEPPPVQAAPTGGTSAAPPASESSSRPTPTPAPPPTRTATRTTEKPKVEAAPVVNSAAAQASPAPEAEVAAVRQDFAKTPATADSSAAGVVLASRGRSAEGTSPTVQSAAIAGIGLPATPPDPRPVEAALPEHQPPVVVDRIEPAFDRRTLRRGETQSVALRVLVDDRGRVARVVVDESVAGSDAELAAINAVLRWTYEPARQDGQPVRRWTTERFEFHRSE